MPNYSVEKNGVYSVKRVFLNGVEVKHCFEADTDEGYVKYYIENENGKLFAAYKENGRWIPVAGMFRTPSTPETEAAWEERHGIVTVEINVVELAN